MFPYLAGHVHCLWSDLLVRADTQTHQHTRVFVPCRAHLHFCGIVFQFSHTKHTNTHTHTHTRTHMQTRICILQGTCPPAFTITPVTPAMGSEYMFVGLGCGVVGAYSMATGKLYTLSGCMLEGELRLGEHIKTHTHAHTHTYTHAHTHTHTYTHTRTCTHILTRTHTHTNTHTYTHAHTHAHVQTHTHAHTHTHTHTCLQQLTF